MSAGVKIYNQHKQTMIDSDSLCFGLSQTHLLTANADNYWFGSVNITNCAAPLIVYELGDINARLYPERADTTADGLKFYCRSFGKNISARVYVFDVASKAITLGQAAIRIYRPDGELVFDNRIRHLNIVGEVQNNLALDPNKHYGILVRSRAPYQDEEHAWRSGRKYYVRTITRRQLAWRENNLLKYELVTLTDHTDWFWADTGALPYSGSTYNTELAKPLLVDLTLIKSLE